MFGNPSSLHQTGKKAKRFINETTDFLFKTFSLSPDEFNLVHHSGASEGINGFFKGLALSALKNQQKIDFYFSTVDHACVYNLKEQLELLGHRVCYFEVDKEGNFNVDALINSLNKSKESGSLTVVNFTYINNETGVIWPLRIAQKIKKETNAIVHVDAVQLVGKMANWTELDHGLDGYTFSGHKFGALKGIGFSFIKKELDWLSLITGGSQQNDLRAGTENALGIYSLKMALEDINENFNADELLISKKIIEDAICKTIAGKGEVVALDNFNRNLNTIFIVLHGHKSEMLSMRFDMLGIDLSTGSACSSGIVKENRILMAMGYSAEDSKSSLRFSFSPLMKKEQAQEYAQKITKTLSDILK